MAYKGEVVFNYKRYRKIAISMMVLIGISGCGSSSTTLTTDTENNMEQNSSLVTEENLTRVEEPVEEMYHLKFIDSPVVNLTYECGDKLARTDAEGNLSCATFPITFSAIEIEIGELQAITEDHKVYPQDLIGVSRAITSNTEVQKIASFLQSLDDDGDVSQYIIIQDNNTTQSKQQKKVLQKRNLPRLLDMSSSEIFTLLQSRRFTPVSLERAEQNLRQYGLELIEVASSYTPSSYTPPPIPPIPTADTTPPVVTLNGDSNLSIILGNGYIEYDANATDADGEELNVTIDDSNLTINKLGSYVVVYSAVDNDGNSAEVNRTVEVVSPNVLVKNLKVTSQACNSFQRLALEPYTLNNNDWGRSYLDSNASGVQCAFSFEENEVIKGGWYWGWPYNNDYQVKGYPEAIYGAKFRTIYHQDSGFPALVDTISSVKVDLAYRDLNITNSYNTALEFWLHNSVDTSMDNIKYEIMLRFDPDGFHPRDVWKNVTIDGMVFDVYKDGDYGDSRVFINFVAKNKVTNMQLDLKQYIDFLVENGFLDMPQLYMSGVEMGVEVIYGSGMLLLDKMDVNLEFNANQLASTKLEESFVAWMSELDGDIDLDKGIDSNHTGLKWRASTTNLDLRKKNGTLIQLVRSTPNSYFFTMFDTSFDMSGEDASVKFTGVLGSDYRYKLMLYDGNNWCMSDKSFDSNSFSLSSADVWEHIAQSDEVIDAFNSDNSLPSLSIDGNCSDINLANIKGFGLYYSLKEDRDTGYFKMDTLALYKSLPKYGIDEKIITEDSVSEYLFGLCTTPAYDTSTNETFISNYKEWVKYLRWPGGSRIEDYDLENSGDTTTYSVGKWTEFMRNEIPSLDFLIGVSSSKGWADGDDVTQYGEGLVNYLNIDYNSSWGDNPALEKPLPLQYVEIGNEPELVSGFSIDGYSQALTDYAVGIHNADPSVKILAPTTIHDSLNLRLSEILKSYGDNIDIVSTHDYTDNPAEYQSDITIAKNYIKKYMKDNERRAKDEVKLAFTEFNSLDHLNRRGVIYEQSWAKIIWHAQTFSYFIQEGLYMSSLWHSYINGGHALYTRDGVPYPLHYALKFWRENIDFSKNPKVALSNSNDSAILITSIKKDDGLTLFVVNNSPYEDKSITLSFKQHQFDNRVTIKTLTHTLLSEFYDEETVADNIDVDRLRYYNPDAVIRSETDDDNVTTTFVKFPKISVDTQLSEGEIVNEQFNHTFPKYTLTVLEIGEN